MGCYWLAEWSAACMHRMFGSTANAIRLIVLLVCLNVLMHLPHDVATTVLYRRQWRMQPLVQLQLPSTQLTLPKSLGMHRYRELLLSKRRGYWAGVEDA
jgi:hypothetical protein